MISWIRNLLAARHNVRAHFWQSLANYTQAGGGMLLGIILARLLNPSDFGEFVFITASLSFLMIPASFSTAQLLISDAGRTPNLLNRVLGLATIVSGIKTLLLMGYVAFSLWQGNSTRANVAIVVALPLVFSDMLTTLRYDMEGRGFFKQNVFLQAAELIANSSVAVALILNDYGIYGLASGAFAGFLVQTLCYLRMYRHRLASMNLDFSLASSQFHTGFWLWLASMSSNWYSRIDKIILGKFGGPSELGYYNRAMNYGPISHVILNSLMTNAAIRSLSFESEAKVKRKRFFKNMAILLSGACANGFFWFFFAEPIVPWLFGSQWQPAAHSFAILGWLGIPYCLLFGSAALLYAGGYYRTIGIIHASALCLLVSLLSLKGSKSTLTSTDTSAIYCIVMMIGGVAMLMAALKSISYSPNYKKQTERMRK